MSHNDRVQGNLKSKVLDHFYDKPQYIYETVKRIETKIQFTPNYKNSNL